MADAAAGDAAAAAAEAEAEAEERAREGGEAAVPEDGAAPEGEDAAGADEACKAAAQGLEEARDAPAAVAMAMAMAELPRTRRRCAQESNDAAQKEEETTAAAAARQKRKREDNGNPKPSRAERLAKRMSFVKQVLDIPVLHPDDNEFASPLKYIASPEVQELGKRYGVIVIQPPWWWAQAAVPDMAMERLRNAPNVRDGFRAYRQVLGQKSVTWMGAESRTFDEFRAAADASLREHFELAEGDAGSPSPSAVEEKYWEKLFNSGSTAVEYGGDLLASAFEPPLELSRFEGHLWDLGQEQELAERAEREAAVAPAAAEEPSGASTHTYVGQFDGGTPAEDTEAFIDEATEAELMKAHISATSMKYSPWNLRLFAFNPGCVNLQRLMGCHAIRGVTSPYTYIGSPFATFAWHVEDHHLYSINYHHAGMPKTWYGVPAAHADRFEKAMDRKVFRPGATKAKRLSSDKPADEMLEAKNVMTDLGPILKSGVQIGRVVQKPGQFVVTFPRAYHCGFSHGFNVGEAVNFATQSWVEAGRKAVERYKERGRSTSNMLFDHERLMRIRDEFYRDGYVK